MAVNNLTSLSQDQFLQLLTAQLKNQDPSNPVTDRDLLTQLSQVSSANGIAQLNTTFSQMLQLQQLTQGSDLIGRTVQYNSPKTGAVISGVVSAVNANNGNITIQIGADSIPLSQVKSVQATPVK